MENTVYTAVATSVGGRGGHVRSSDGVLDFEVRIPKEMGGPGGPYTNPEQLFAAGYAACFGSAVSHFARLRRIRTEPTVTAEVGILREDGRSGYSLSVILHVTLPDLEPEVAEELVRQGHEMCPYSNAVRNNVEVKISVNDKELTFVKS